MNRQLVCLLLGSCFAGSAAALGLGDLNVRSYLGQPLHATIKLLGANDKTAADCFSLAASEGATVPTPRAKLNLEQRNDQVLLHIRTTYSINDPIAQFALISDCESRLRRDYVVLLDPPPANPAPRDVNEEPVTPPLPTPRVAPKPKPESAPAQTRRAPTVTRKAAVATSRALQPSRKMQPEFEPEHRLVLSGRHGLSSESLRLRLDTNLPDLDRPPVENLTPDELSDENTALTRKLAHLETQLHELQKRNAELDPQSRGVQSATTPKPVSEPSRWPLYLLISGLLIAAGLLVLWLRKSWRNHVIQPAIEEVWTSSSESLPDLDRMTSDSWEKPASKPASKLSESERVIEFEPSFTDKPTEVNDDILDQAEVYMAHGHGDLAIHLLQEHLRTAPDESPVPWLLLLDLLHREGDTEGYEIASKECRLHFNVNLSGHPISQDNETGKGLEAYPHLLEQLVSVWGTPTVEDFFHDLIYDKRGGTRIGFEPGAYRDILMLRALSRDTQEDSI